MKPSIRMIAAVGLASVLPFSASSQQPIGLVTLAALKDQSRPLLIFAARPDDSQLLIQLRTLREHAAETADRQIVPIALPYRAAGSTDARLSDEEAEMTRRRFNIPPGDFTVILLGKDGSEKLRVSKPLPMQKLDAVIDAMPMRRDEMKHP